MHHSKQRSYTLIQPSLSKHFLILFFILQHVFIFQTTIYPSMPLLRDRSQLKPAEVFLPWKEGDPHTPMALRWKKSKIKKINKKYRDIKKDKDLEKKKVAKTTKKNVIKKTAPMPNKVKIQKVNDVGQKQVAGEEIKNKNNKKKPTRKTSSKSNNLKIKMTFSKKKA